MKIIFKDGTHINSGTVSNYDIDNDLLYIYRNSAMYDPGDVSMVIPMNVVKAIVIE